MLYYLVYYYFLIVCTAFFSLSGKEERHKPVAKLCRVIIKSAQSYIKMLIYLCFAHGFCVLSETALFTYKCTDLYHPECDGGVRWDDPTIGIQWPISDPILSDKDRNLPLLGELR